MYAETSSKHLTAQGNHVCHFQSMHSILHLACRMRNKKTLQTRSAMSHHPQVAPPKKGPPCGGGGAIHYESAPVCVTIRTVHYVQKEHRTATQHRGCKQHLFVQLLSMHEFINQSLDSYAHTTHTAQKTSEGLGGAVYANIEHTGFPACRGLVCCP